MGACEEAGFATKRGGILYFYPVLQRTGVGGLGGGLFFYVARRRFVLVSYLSTG